MRQDVRLLVVTSLVAVGAGLSVAILVINAAGGPRVSPTRAPINVGRAGALRAQIHSNGPACFPDLARGDRTFCVALIHNPPQADRLAALQLLLPQSTERTPGQDGSTDRCFAQWDRSQQRFEDCHGKPVGPETMREFPLHTGGRADDPVLVDVRQNSKQPETPAPSNQK